MCTPRQRWMGPTMSSNRWDHLLVGNSSSDAEAVTDWRNLVEPPHLAELVAITGNERVTGELLFVWVGVARQFAAADEDLFTGDTASTDAVRLARLRSAVGLISDLVPLLDTELAWLVASQTNGFTEGPDVAVAVEAKVLEVARSLVVLRGDIERAAQAIKPKKGRPLRPTPPLLLLISLTSRLEEIGLKFSAAENSKMVRAVRLFWQAAGLEGDPRDQIRTLLAKRVAGAKSRGA